MFGIRDILVYGSGCGTDPRMMDPFLWLTDPDADPALLVSDLQDANKKYFFFSSFYACSFLKVHLNHKEVTKQYKSSFFFIFLLVDRRIRIQIRLNKLRIRILIQEAQNKRILRIRIWNTASMTLSVQTYIALTTNRCNSLHRISLLCLVRWTGEQTAPRSL